MKNFTSPDFPIGSADCAAIEAMFIELMRARDAAPEGEATDSVLQFSDPPSNENEQDLRTDWGR